MALFNQVAESTVEKNDQILTPFDKEMTKPIVEELASKGVSLLLGQSAEAVEQTAEGLVVCLNSGQRLPAQLVIFGIGVRPENVTVQGVARTEGAGRP